MSFPTVSYKKFTSQTTYSLDFMLAGNLTILNKFFSCSASSANVCFRDDIDLVSEPTVSEGMFFVSFSLPNSRLSSVLNE